MVDRLRNQVQSFSLPWPPAALSPNFTGKLKDKISAKKSYKHDSWAVLLEQKVRKMSDDRITIEYKFFPPTNHAHDDDNLIGRMKSGRDQIARHIGVDDKVFRTAEPVIMPSQGKPGRVQVTLRPSIVNVPIEGVVDAQGVVRK